MRVVEIIDRISKWTGLIVAWLIVPLTVVVVYEVALRHILNAPTSWSYDVSWMLYSTLFMLGGAYTLWLDKHVRIDILYRAIPEKGKVIFDLIFYLVIFLPTMVILTWQGTKYAHEAWLIGERLSTSMWRFPSGPIKTVIPLGFFLMVLQGIAETIRRVLVIVKGDGSWDR